MGSASCFGETTRFFNRPCEPEEEEWLKRHPSPWNLYFYSDQPNKETSHQYYYDTMLVSKVLRDSTKHKFEKCPPQKYPLYVFTNLVDKELSFFNLSHLPKWMFEKITVPWLDENYIWLQTVKNPEKMKSRQLAKLNPVYFSHPCVYKVSQHGFNMSPSMDATEKMLHPLVGYFIRAFLQQNRRDPSSVFVSGIKRKDFSLHRSAFLKGISE